MPYQIPKTTYHTRYEIKKSQFIGYAAHAPCREDAMAFVASLKAKYPDAGHHCWAYLLGSPAAPESIAMSDDGEPSGTAGKPILNVLQHNDIGDIIIVVVRYFGGIKLGAGGLVRAYSSSAQMTLESLPTHQLVKQTSLRVTADFKHEQFVRHFAQQHSGSINETQYHTAVTIAMLLPDQAVETFTSLGDSMGFTVEIGQSAGR
ncbi:YigZ family protein [Salinimonas chungwhensis]|uniref:YigZ family protein n=1 Tax=Salinimonas chungwhensis TaxID=265425 RepID=UPI0003767DF8|nr:YigZ family protein [Salinimonas chungwhensis]